MFKIILAFALLGLSACAGHRELKSPCTANADLFSNTAFASELSDGCGPMRLLNVDDSGDLAVAL